MEETIKTIRAAGEAISPYMPLIKVATDLVEKIIDIYKTAEYNKNICETLVGRVKLTENAIETLQRRKQRNEDKLCDDEYYKAFNRFIYVLEEIKEFAADITNIHGFRKYTNAYSVKEKFQKLTHDYDIAMKDLHFTMAIANEEQKKIDDEALKEDLAEMSKYLEKIRTDILDNNDKANIIHDMVKHMKKHLDDEKPLYYVNKIESKDLTSPLRVKSDDKRGKGPNFIIRKIYKGLEVACKSKTCLKTQRLFEILVKLSEYVTAAGDIIPWLAPEKLTGSRYTTQCEIFSFGMLLWELVFEKIPYQGWEAKKIVEHIAEGHRERITFESSTPKICQEEYKKIINDTWKQEPQERISFMKLLDMLEGLYNSIRIADNNSLDILPDKLELSGSKETSDADLGLTDKNVSPIKPVISIEEGIQAFKDKDHQKAWECFDFHAENNSIVAKYWKGRYLWEGYLDDIQEREEEGKKLLKEAADEGNSDAQLRYAFTLLNDLEEENNQQIFLEYLKKAADEGNNPVAQFNLGDIYYKGKCNIPKDENEGIKWLIKAALQDNSKATKLLNQLKVDVYDINKCS
ncbi:uncharacterized protein OCT59_028456 [Rhizophagus irregularis]|uniref:uncharacterized protein n=1 Tax=Rhizophagus irregularis TaxID=588596 RepID=UPI0033277339|nr:hypothetical protein OCT59_028456 [Rhizophagus irregularis]